MFVCFLFGWDEDIERYEKLVKKSPSKGSSGNVASNNERID